MLFRERLDPNEVHKVKGRVEVLEAMCERLENDLADARQEQYYYIHNTVQFLFMMHYTENSRLSGLIFSVNWSQIAPIKLKN